MLWSWEFFWKTKPIYRLRKTTQTINRHAGALFAVDLHTSTENVLTVIPEDQNVVQAASVRTRTRGNYCLVIVDTATPTEARISIPFAQRHVVALPLNRHIHLVSINTNDKPTHNCCATENNHIWTGNGQVKWCVDIRLYCNVSQDSKHTSSFKWDDEKCRS
jgi:hypothetical protein